MTQEQINQIRAQDKLPPISQVTGANSVDRNAELDNAWGVVKPTLSEKVTTDIKTRGANLLGAIKGTSPESKGENVVTRGIQATKEGFGGVADVAGDVLKTGIDTVFPKSQEQFSNMQQKAKDIGLKSEEKSPSISDRYNKFVEEQNAKGRKTGIQVLADFLEKHPDASKHVDTILKTAGATGEIANTILGAEAGTSIANKAPILGETSIKGVETATQNAISNTAEKVTNTAKTLETARATTKAQKATNQALESITPNTKDLTPTEYEQLLRQKKITPKTSTKPSTYILSPEEKVVAKKYEHLLQEKDPVKNSTNIINEIANKDSEVEQFLTKNNGAFNDGELKNFVSEKLKGISDITIPDTRINKLKKDIINNFVKELPKNDMKSLWKARKEFDQKIESAFSGSPTLQNQVKKEFRNAVQDFIAERTPNTTYKTAMKDMSELYNIHETVATKAVKEKGNSWIKQWIKENPIKAKAIGWTAGLIGAEQVYQHVK